MSTTSDAEMIETQKKKQNVFDKKGALHIKWKENHIMLAQFGLITLFKIKYETAEAFYKNEEVPFYVPQFFLENLFKISVEMSQALAKKESKVIKGFEASENMIDGKVDDGKGFLVLKKEEAILSTLEFLPEDMQPFFLCIQQAIPIVVAINLQQADCFKYFVAAVHKIIKTKCSEKATSTKTTSEQASEDDIQIMAEMLSMLREHTYYNSPQISESHKTINAIKEAMTTSMALKSQYEAFLIQQFVTVNFRLFYVYFHAYFKSK